MYEPQIRRNITIIRGDSATGKTTLLEMLDTYVRLGEESGIYLECDVPVDVYMSDDRRKNWRYDLKEAVVPGDILLVNTGKGRKHVRVTAVDYVTGEKICRKYRRAVKNETEKL